MDNLQQALTRALDELLKINTALGIEADEQAKSEQKLIGIVNGAIQDEVCRMREYEGQVEGECKRLLKIVWKLKKAIGEVDEELEGEVEIQRPLLHSLNVLKIEYESSKAAYDERFDVIADLYRRLQAYVSHLDEGFTSIKIPDLDALQQAEDPTTLISDISTEHVTKLEQEIQAAQVEYANRKHTITTLSAELIQTWAELGRPNSDGDDFDKLVIANHRDRPEKIGLVKNIIELIRKKRESALLEKQNRIEKIAKIRALIEPLWERLGLEEADKSAFLRKYNGYTLDIIKAYEQEYATLLELKRQNLNLFIQDARRVLEDLWKQLFFSEEEMLEFSPAFTDVYSDASLSAHETEIVRLKALIAEIQPILNLISRHITLMEEKRELETAAADTTRLTSKGPRDPGRLLREEKSRKRVAKELPKVTADLRKLLEDWELRNAMPIFVDGENYKDTLESLPHSSNYNRPQSRNSAKSQSRSPTKVPKHSSMSGAEFRRPTTPTKNGTWRDQSRSQSRSPLKGSVSSRNVLQTLGSSQNVRNNLNAVGSIRGREPTKLESFKAHSRTMSQQSDSTSHTSRTPSPKKDSSRFPLLDNKSTIQHGAVKTMRNISAATVQSEAYSVSNSDNWETYESGSEGGDHIGDQSTASIRNLSTAFSSMKMSTIRRPAY